jgi:hypothetical protein
MDVRVKDWRKLDEQNVDFFSIREMGNVDFFGISPEIRHI